MLRLPAMSGIAAACLLLPAAVWGCKDKAPEGTASSASATASAAPSASVALKVQTPKALDVKALQKTLKCGGPTDGPCAVLSEFANCIDWNPVTQSGDGRWLGESHVVTQGTFVSDYAMVRSRRVNVADVGPGQLPAKIGLTNIESTRPAELRHAASAIRAFRRGDVAKQTNSAVRYAKERDKWPEAFAMQAEGKQVYGADQGGAYYCALKDQRLLVVRKANTREHPADGVYATLWPVSW